MSRPRQQFCRRGEHLMSDTPEYRRRRRGCAECERLRESIYQKRRRAEEREWQWRQDVTA